ncbi:MAG: phage baseplate assembly protein V [Pseudomonadota bacterium]
MNDSNYADLVSAVRKRFFGRYRGLVVDTADSTERGRLLVQVPAILDELNVWAMPSTPYAGDAVGFYTLPPIGSGVWVVFEGGDPSYPVWTGGFWADNQLPDESDEAIKVIKTDTLYIRMDDTESEILLNANDAATVEIKDKVLQTVGSGSHLVEGGKVVADSGGTGKVEVTSSSVKVNGGALEVT